MGVGKGGSKRGDKHFEDRMNPTTKEVAPTSKTADTKLSAAIERNVTGKTGTKNDKSV